MIAAARARGLVLVTLTDVDTIDGCLEVLDGDPSAGDLILSEEVVARDPRSGARPHVLLYGITEAQHREARRLKGDVRELAAYVRAEGIAAALGPWLHSLPERAWHDEPSRSIAALFDRFEVRNASWGRTLNRMALRLVQEYSEGRPFGVVAGSGAHTASRVGAAVTLSFARTPAGFLEELRAGRTWAGGAEGDRWAVVRHGLDRARSDVRARRARRRRDADEVMRFQEKARQYGSTAEAAVPLMSDDHGSVRRSSTGDPFRPWVSTQ